MILPCSPLPSRWLLPQVCAGNPGRQFVVVDPCTRDCSKYIMCSGERQVDVAPRPADLCRGSVRACCVLVPGGRCRAADELCCVCAHRSLPACLPGPAGGSGWLYTCAPGTLFNSRTNGCDRPANVVCTGSSGAAAPAPGTMPPPAPPSTTIRGIAAPGQACGSGNGMKCSAGQCCSKWGEWRAHAQPHASAFCAACDAAGSPTTPPSFS